MGYTYGIQKKDISIRHKIRKQVKDIAQLKVMIKSFWFG